ncbi:hypothetical protein ACQP2P_24265 [Dactylosporangium sp. CA-139114]|uniref:hypothetical protein n=1 Tax=Dactylosporangium sp. CA-139114 TaxID=3239931 RepID=UPI003D97E0FA
MTGMYEEYKEIPAALLARLLERPRDSAWVDGLLFEESLWSAAVGGPSARPSPGA